MTDTVNQLVSYGLHSSSSDWTTTPSLINVRLAENNHLWPKPEYNKIVRAGVVPDTNDPVPGLRGPPNQVLGDISMEVEGLSGGGAGNDVESSTLSTSLASAYESVFGVAATSSQGDTTDATDAGSGTTVTMDGSPNATADEWVLVRTTTGGAYQARQAISRASSDLTVCRALTTIVGGADTADEGEVNYGGTYWYVSNAAASHKHQSWKVEHVGGVEGQFNGCFPQSAGWSMAFGEVLRFNMGGMTATEWTKQDAQGGSYSAPTSGDKVVCSPIYVYIGNSLMMASEVGIDLGLQVAPRPAGQAAANMFGHVVTRMAPTISMTLTFGDVTAPQEATNALINTWQGTYANSTYTADVLIQAGDRPGGCAAWRAEAMDFTSVQRVDVNGLEGVTITGTCTEASGALGPLVHAIF